MAHSRKRPRRFHHTGSAICLGTAVAATVVVVFSPNRSLDTFAYPGALLLVGFAIAGFLIFSRSTSKQDAFEQIRHINDIQLSPALHDQDFREQDLTNIVLRSRTLDRSTFASATMEAADLTRASCVGADFARSKLHAARFERADLREASLRGADLSDVNFNHAVLIDADLRGANMSGADLRDANMSGANLCGTDLRSTIVNRTVLDRTTYDSSTRLPYNLTSDRRASSGLEATVDSSLRPKESVRRELPFEPGFLVASLASAGIALGVLAISGVGSVSQPEPRTEVAGQVEVAVPDDGRLLIIDADSPIEARLALDTGGTITVRLDNQSQLESRTLQSVTAVTLIADDHETVRCALLQDGQAVAVKRLTRGSDTVRCPLDAP